MEDQDENFDLGNRTSGRCVLSGLDDYIDEFIVAFVDNDRNKIFLGLEERIIQI